GLAFAAKYRTEDAVVAFAEASPWPDAESLTEHVFGSYESPGSPE
ncbi:MAG: hypothetical protein GWP05_08595, partial [Anaerolineaceae bacterium]|nr:hypothetical protein [Anaerolineaceae bacterium]